MKKRVIFQVLSGLIISSMLLASCTTTGEDKGTTSTAPSGSQTETSTAQPTGDGGEKILRVNNTSEPGALHPALAMGTHDSFLLEHMFEGLYEKNPDGGDPILAAAESVEVSEDGKTWTFKINPNAKWSNGDLVTAHDFVASYQFCLIPENNARYSTQFFVFENAEAILKKEKPMEDLGIKALDDSTLELKLNTPMTFLPDYLTHYTFYPVNAALQESNPDWYKSADNYVSNGAFVLKEWKNKEFLRTQKNEHFRRANDVKLDGMHYVIIEDAATTWQMYQAGELDANYPLPPAVIEQLNKEGSAEIHNFDTLSTDYYLFNTTKAPFNNVKVRTALAMAIDRKALCENVLKGGHTPTTIMTCPGLFDGSGDYHAAVGPLFTEDVAQAKILLEEGLKEAGMTMDNFKFSILYNTTDQNKKVAEAIQAMWIQNLGVNVTLENAEFQIVLDRRKAGDYDICRAGWSGDYSDPFTFLELLTSWSDFNDSKWKNDQYDKLMTQVQNSADNDERMKLMKEAETLMIADLPIMPLFNKKDNWVIKEYVSGYFKPINQYVHFNYADMNK